MVKLKVLNIIQDSIVDGEGLRVVIFLSGCTHRCKGCHNPESWNIDYGYEYSIQEIIDEIELKSVTKKVTLSGGDPMLQCKGITLLAKELKRLSYNIWIYTGYEYEDIINDECMNEVVSYCDVLVDGKFVEELKDTTLAFRGSSNQRVIKLKEDVYDNSNN